MTAGLAIETLRATGAVLAFTIVALAACWGLGRLLLRAWRGEALASVEPDTTAWVGWGAALAVIQLWHLALAPAWPLAAALVLAGAAGLALGRGDLRALLTDAWRRRRGLLVAVALAALWLANTALAPPRNGDSGLYHLQAVRWAATFPDVPGLANVHGRFGFISSYTLYLALPEALAGPGRACHLANAALLLLPIARGLGAFARIAGGGWRASSLFDALATLPLAERVWSEQVLTSATPDLPVFVLGIVATSLLLRAIEESDGCAPARRGALIWLAAVGLTVKLSLLAFGAAAAAVALALAVHEARAAGRRGRDELRSLAPLAVACALAVLPWLARSVVLSGYPLYPFPGVSAPADWRVPRAAALDDYNWVRSWARRPGADWHAVLANGGWLGDWARRLVGSRYTLLTFCLPLALAVPSLAAVALARVRSRRPLRPLAAVAPAAASLAYWFATAPEPRLAGSAAWALGLGAAAAAGIALAPFGPSAANRRRALLASAAVGVFVAFMLFRRGLLPVAAGPDGGFHPAPAVAVSRVTTAAGLQVNVPAEGEACWNAPLPCTPWPPPALRLRREGEVRRGFTVAPAPAGEGR